MKRPWLVYTILGVLLYLAFLIISAPATLLALAIHRASHGTVSLQQVSGSVWSGHGELVFQRSYGSAYRFGAGTWGVNPLWIVTGRIRGTAQFAEGTAQLKGKFSLSPGALTLIDSRANFDAGLIAALYTPAALANPEGSLAISSPEFSVATQNVRGNATIEWRGAGTSLANVKPLGDYRLVAIGDGKSVQLKLDTLVGALTLRGNGQWRADDGRMKFDLFARAVNRLPELEPFLKLIGREQANGERALTIDLQLR